MKKLKYYWALLRPVNLGIIALTQFVFILHGSGYTWANIRFPEIIWMVLSVIFSAAAGFVINDIFDIEEDQINEPALRIVARHISLTKSRIFYFLLLTLSLFFGFLSSYSMGFLCLAIGIMLFYYSSDLKGTNLWGNLLVSFVTGAVVFTAARAVITLHNGYFAEYALLSFLISMPREITKDIEDIVGDKAQEYETFPIVMGVKKAVLLSQFFLGLVFLSILYLMVFHGNVGYNIFCTLAILLPIFILFWRMQKALEKKHFSQISLYLKLLMISGICSVFFL